jgi:hypothetical protein
VHFFWGTFDLALTRYSGRPAQPRPGAGLIERVGGDAEVICGGWWPGDDRTSQPAFFAYGYPAPKGMENAAVRPRAAAWSAEAGEFLLPYESVRHEPDPSQAILEFLESTYAASAEVMGWDPDLTRVITPADPRRTSSR